MERTINTVELHDGRIVSTYSEEWRAEAEARTMLSWPLHNRRVHMQGVLEKRGAEGHRELENLIHKIWTHRQVEKLLQMDCDSERIQHLTRLERATNQRTRENIEKILEGRLSAQVV